jgi:hypothetical protein
MPPILNCGYMGLKTEPSTAAVGQSTADPEEVTTAIGGGSENDV